LKEGSEQLVEYSDPVQAVNGTHAIIILTEWDTFTSYDYNSFYQSMSKPTYLFDGRNLLDEEKIKKIGFRYYRVGKSSQSYV